MVLNYRNKLLTFERPVVMGILNATPDSFYAGSRIDSKSALTETISHMISDGMDILDIGAYSTRPQAIDISTDEEINRLSEVLEIVRMNFPDLPVSVDTFRAKVADHVVRNFNVGIINDISGGTLDNEMFNTIARLNVVYILMHMKGTPQTMQNECNYSNISSEVLAFLQQKLSELHLLGVKDVIVDPGFGFAKTLEQNYELLGQLEVFQVLDVPLLAGVSRKSMIYKLLGTTAEQALNGTTAIHMAALMKGAQILRAHDVKEAAETIRIFEAMVNNVPIITDF